VQDRREDLHKFRGFADQPLPFPLQVVMFWIFFFLSYLDLFRIWRFGFGISL